MQRNHTTYIALLRAINIGGRVVKMEQLRNLFSELGLINVRTFIQSGNVFFDSPQTDRTILTRTIEQHLAESLGYEVSVCLRTIPELQQLLARNPFHHLEVTADMRLYVVFLSESLPVKTSFPIRSPKGDIEIIEATLGEVFVVLYDQDKRASNPSAFVEKTFQCRATARFFHTVEKMLHAAQSHE